MKPIFILAKEGEVSEKVIVGGDPGKVRALSTLLKEPKLVNENRGFLVYTGWHKGKMLSIASHGIGGPSIAIVLEELAMLGATAIVRYGTAGSLVSSIKVGDLLVVESADHDEGGFYSQYFGGKKIDSTADPALTKALAAEFKKAGLNYHSGKVFSTEAFYAEDEHFAERHSKAGRVAVEMECAPLFALSKYRGWKSAAVVLISDSLVEKQYKFLSPDEINRISERGAVAIFDALLKFKD